MTDDLIAHLTQDLKPVRPMRMKPVLIGAGLGLIVAVLVIGFGQKFRPEILALASGTLPKAFVVIGKPLLFLTIALNSLWMMSGLYRPEGRLNLWRVWPLSTLIGIVILSLVFEITGQGWAEVATRLHDPILTCFSTIWIGGVVGYGLLYWFWLRRSATSYPALLNGLAGLTCAGLMASAYALHCDRDAPVYILTFYGFAVTSFAGLAAAFGPRLLKW